MLLTTSQIEQVKQSVRKRYPWKHEDTFGFSQTMCIYRAINDANHQKIEQMVGRQVDPLLRTCSKCAASLLPEEIFKIPMNKAKRKKNQLFHFVCQTCKEKLNVK